MKQIKDYLHLYLGCDVQVARLIYPTGNKVEKLLPIHITLSKTQYRIKPILRPLSDMTEEEKEIAVGFADLVSCEQTSAMAMAETTRYLLSKHFDLFGLIDAGIAIDTANIL